MVGVSKYSSSSFGEESFGARGRPGTTEDDVNHGKIKSTKTTRLKRFRSKISGYNVTQDELTAGSLLLLLNQCVACSENQDLPGLSQIRQLP